MEINMLKQSIKLTNAIDIKTPKLNTHKENVIYINRLSDHPNDFTGLAIVGDGDPMVHFVNGEYHNENGPAVERTDGSEEWYIHNRRQSVGGRPSEIRSNGDKLWHQDGKLHRENGAAIERHNGERLYFLYGKQLSPEQFWERAPKQSHILNQLVKLANALDDREKIKNANKVDEIIERYQMETIQAIV
jgi:hypothetical protein